MLVLASNSDVGEACGACHQPGGGQARSQPIPCLPCFGCPPASDAAAAAADADARARELCDVRELRVTYAPRGLPALAQLARLAGACPRLASVRLGQDMPMAALTDLLLLLSTTTTQLRELAVRVRLPASHVHPPGHSPTHSPRRSSAHSPPPELPGLEALEIDAMARATAGEPARWTSWVRERAFLHWALGTPRPALRRLVLRGAWPGRVGWPRAADDHLDLSHLRALDSLVFLPDSADAFCGSLRLPAGDGDDDAGVRSLVSRACLRLGPARGLRGLRAWTAVLPALVDRHAEDAVVDYAARGVLACVERAPLLDDLTLVLGNSQAARAAGRVAARVQARAHELHMTTLRISVATL